MQNINELLTKQEQALLLGEEENRGRSYRPTDFGNAERLVAAHGRDVKYCWPWRKWYVWDGSRWMEDTRGEVLRRMKATVRGMYAEAGRIDDDKERREFLKFVLRSEQRDRLKAAAELAASEPETPILPANLDADPWLLNCLNGTIDLKTGELRKHRREDFITKLCPVNYDPEARSPLFDAFLERVLPDVDVRGYVQKALGYTLSGDTGLEKLFFAYGPSATGKSTLLAAVQAVLDDYAATADFESFLQQRRPAGGARNDIARLAGRRFVLCVEVDEGRKLAESLINSLTGGDVITARFLYSEGFEFIPRFKLWFAANNRPRVSGPEGAIWRRLVQVPFCEVIPESERDPEVKARLRTTERPAVLAWLVQGCLSWQKEGLKEPDAVKRLTADYREESDPLKDFLAECCTFEPTAQAPNTEIWQVYQDWCKTNGERYPLGRKKFSQALLNRGLDQYHTGRKRAWIGIGLNAGVFS
ncbi:MAG: phage/plasmid primase, P4 family [Bacillota bacterium]